jgi:hypothetical protein
LPVSGLERLQGGLNLTALRLDFTMPLLKQAASGVNGLADSHSLFLLRLETRALDMGRSSQTGGESEPLGSFALEAVPASGVK